MNYLKSKFGLVGLALLSLVLGGCLVSGTFIVVEVIEFSATSANFYAEAVDLTGNSEWEDHKDDIDNIDVVGFEVWATNNTASALTFSAYLDSPQPALYDNATDVEDNTTLVIDGITISGNVGVSQKVVSYAQSMNYLQNTATLKSLVKAGVFDYYAITAGNTTGTIDSIKVVITVSASS